MATHVARQAACARRPAVPAGVPIPAPKITAPGVPDSALPRPRITKLIAQGTRWCPLTAVTAPAGAGKTMILALWAAAEPGPVAWVTVIKASLSKEKQDEIQQAPHGPGRSMSSAPAGGGEPGTGSRRRSPATLVTRCRHRLLPAVKALRAAAAASRLARA